MIRCVEWTLSQEKDRTAAAAFLARNDLVLEDLDRFYVLLDEQEHWIGCGGRYRNVLKCIALDAAWRGEGLLDQLMSQLITDGYRQGFQDLFLYTKSALASLFEPYGFIGVADTGVVSLMHRGPNDISQVLRQMDVSIDPQTAVGAIVVNANPFTLGHRFLIETASRQVDRLLVFVVENDASRFSFEDRFRLVREGVADLPNVKVLPSSVYIISNATFPSYFLKETRSADEQHALLDATIFKRYFVRYFTIKKRFLGEEPLDPTTRLYNESLLRILPPECEVIIIPRKCLGDRVISASAVRRALDLGDFATIRTLVPDVTYQYLKERYDKQS